MPDDRPQEDGLLKPGQVADMLRVTKRTLWRMAKQDGFPLPVRFSRKTVRWRAAEIQQYIAALQCEPLP
ncbi:helix-turn-helix transcriptional regulator [Gemmata palustris]